MTALMVIDDVLAVGEHVTEDFVGADKRPEFFSQLEEEGTMPRQQHDAGIVSSLGPYPA